MKIAIIDDSKEVLNMIKYYLNFHNYEAHCFRLPNDAIEQIPELKPNIIISDYVMFDMDGLEVIDKLKLKNVNSNFILFTSVNDYDLKQECERKNIKYVYKAGKMEALKKSLEEIRCQL